MPDIPQFTRIDLEEVRDRNRAAREIISALAEAMPSVAELWFRVNAALTDTPVLLSEVNRLVAELVKVRRDRANLVAVARAALSAERDAEPDPLYYVRDELRAQGHLPPESRGRR
ncbi:hypothetical protein [Actinomadura sp. WMMB 499]|uniref:hypothetical protein n=1 Tax=Actinomadura sp. WMMB 499 TaxID=1219491 RepID=UPI0012450340|nr:hypothetical protein [Actinomadura sp. WMMB 499]QFG26522.1 hypothetical protein F7P10_40695 [Actinomadura sp. WMMB 499]